MDTTPRQRRRRGTELEHAILDAAWEELVDSGFARLTMETVAARAQTGVAVLYRRWPNKDALVIAALEHHRATRPVPLPDTGSLREDLRESLRGMGQARAGFFAITAAASFAGLVGEGRRSPAEVRDQILGEQGRSRARAMFERAHERGEIDLARIPESVVDLPATLVRHDLLMSLRPVERERIDQIVDEIVMPLVLGYSRGERGEAGAGTAGGADDADGWTPGSRTS